MWVFPLFYQNSGPERRSIRSRKEAPSGASQGWMPLRRTLIGLGHLRTLLSRHTTPGGRLLAGFLLACTLWPVDLLPDVLPVIGQLDDAIAIGILLLQAYRMLKQQHQGSPEEADRTVPRRLRNVIDV